VRRKFAGIQCLRAVAALLVVFYHLQLFEQKMPGAPAIPSQAIYGMSGVDLQSQLNAEDYQIPIIFITAHGDEKMRLRAMRDGAVAFLAKPFDNSVLLDRVRTCLNVTQDEE